MKFEFGITKTIECKVSGFSEWSNLDEGSIKTNEAHLRTRVHEYVG